MANNHSECVANSWLSATPEQAEVIIRLANECDSGIEIAEDKRQQAILVFWPNGAVWEMMRPELLKELSELIAANALDYLQFGEAWYCDKYRDGEFGGCSWRLYANGLVEQSVEVWTGNKRHWLVSGRKPGQETDTTAYVTTEYDASPIDAFIRQLYDEIIAQNTVDDDDFVTINPDTDEPWAIITMAWELGSPPHDERYV